MPRHVIVVDRLSDWRWNTSGLVIQTVDTFIAAQYTAGKRPQRVINLCRRYGYLSGGYYCSLLAESRGDLPMPTITDIVDLAGKSSYAFAVPDLERILRKTIKRMANPPETGFSLRVFFGHADDARFRRLAAELFDIFRYPLLELDIRHNADWFIHRIGPFAINRIKPDQDAYFEETLRRYLRVPKTRRKGRSTTQYDLAVLVEPGETLPPSNETALRRLIRAGEARRVGVELITARDLARLSQFDALFIRVTTALDHYSFRFARKAELEGMPVIDDSRSILRCTNKVYLAEAMKAAGVSTPRTEFLNRSAMDEKRIDLIEQRLGYPIVLKIPDGSFSRGVKKVENRAQLLNTAKQLFEHSRLILAQEYMYTPFDWRIGVLAGQPFFACRYYMSRSHWQIYHHKEGGKIAAGGWETFAVEQAPAQVVETAVRATALMGDGLYGVDLKETETGVHVIEVNDNPNIDSGVEDKILKGALYDRLIGEFITRIDHLRGS